MIPIEYASAVFLNCPFDAQYKPIFESIVFAIMDCGYWPRCALEIDDSSEVRIDKIFKIIADCKYGVHDISRTEVTSARGLPRFNVPLELGMFLAAKRFGSGKQKKKVCLILDSAPYSLSAIHFGHRRPGYPGPRKQRPRGDRRPARLAAERVRFENPARRGGDFSALPIIRTGVAGHVPGTSTGA